MHVSGKWSGSYPVTGMIRLKMTSIANLRPQKFNYRIRNNGHQTRKYMYLPPVVVPLLIFLQIHFFVHGNVQGLPPIPLSPLTTANINKGVFFRKFTIERAVFYSLTGYVRNIGNGKVEGEAQGEEESIKHFLKDLDKGPPAAHVVRVDKTDKEVVEGEEEYRKVRSVK